MNQEKTEGQQLKDELAMQRKNAGLTLDQTVLEEADTFCQGYKQYLDNGKIEREAVEEAVKLAEEKGFVPFDYNKKYNPGDKVYYNNRGKALILAVVGTKSMEQGINIVAAHIDSPRLDLKPNPLYEDNEIAFFKTHYYGGIKKYQWTSLPLAIHGVVVKADGQQVKVAIGEAENDPVFCVTDLLPHLAGEQMQRKATEIVRGEELNVILGLTPFRDEEISDRVKLNILRLLNEKYGIREADFLSAELEVVPAISAKDVGLDRSLVGGYGQDDKVCAYTGLQAILDCQQPETTAVCILADKEEIGSEGNSGLKCAYLKYFIADLAKPYGLEGRTVLSHSRCLSADVNAAFDPTFPNVHEKNNASFVNYGVVITKYTGSRGKSGSNDASAEFMGYVRRLLDEKKVVWQTGELGKVDEGGGGTVAAYIANLNVDVIDVGVPVLSMHAPFELTAKIDVYMAYQAFRAFFEGK